MPSVSIPQLTLNDGNAMPQLGLGVWKIDPPRISEVLGHAVDAGYRHIDTAHAYHNEAAVGQAVREHAIPREEFFITTKLWNDRHGFAEARQAFEDSLDRMGLDYIDMYLIHWPVPMVNRYVESWQAMIELRDAGRIKSIGVSNFEDEHLTRLIDETGVTPAVNQIEMHPNFQQRGARDLHDRLGIQIESWSPLGQGNKADNAAIGKIAEKHGKSASQIVLRWHIEQGFALNPRSGSAAHIRENADIFDFSLDADDMAVIAPMDRADGRLGPKPGELGPVNLPPEPVES